MKSLAGRAAPHGVARVSACALAVGLALVSFQAQAQTMDWGEEYARRIKSAQEVSPLGDDAFGDQVSLFNGTVTFTATDISLAGNDSLPVELARFYDTQEVSTPKAFADWDWDVPHISTVQADNPTTTLWNPTPVAVQNGNIRFDPEEYWTGNTFHVRGGGGQLMPVGVNPKRVKPTIAGFSPDLGTKDGWYFDVVIDPVDGARYAIGYSPKGHKYTFRNVVTRGYPAITHPWGYTNTTPGYILFRKKFYLFPTKIEDQFGNSVTYTWTGNRLDKIESSDGKRKIVLTRNGNVVTATAGTRTWTYTSGATFTVTHPDLSTTTYAKSGHRLDVVPYVRISGSGAVQNVPTEDIHCSVGSLIKSDEVSTYTVSLPSGASAEFSFSPMRHGRMNVDYFCQTGLDETRNRNNRWATSSDVWSLKSKTISGVGLPTATYSYDYADLDAGYVNQPPSWDIEPGWNDQNGSPPAPNYKRVTVKEPDGTEQVHSFGKDWEINEGQLLKVETKKAGITYKTVTNTYITDAEAATLLFPDDMGYAGLQTGDRLPSRNRPLKFSSTVQDGVTFTSRVGIGTTTACEGTYCFDAMARSTAQVKASSLGHAKTEITEYHDNRSRWIVGQVGKTTVNGLEVSSTSYDPSTALPTVIREHGEVRYTLAYNGTGVADTAGTLKSVTDGGNSVTTLSSWVLGIPTYIKFPVTPDSPTGAERRATVDAVDGVITSVTDENGSKTCYDYDAMLRIEKVTYTSETSAGVCDTSAWNATASLFEPVTTAELGTAGLHWRRTVTTGSGRKITYFDALWRPVLVREEDANNAATVRFTAKAFDANGRLLHEYYPKGPGVTSVTQFTQGKHYAYDALDRVTTMTQDSELGLLTTTTEYLAGFKRRITNPNGKVTTQTFQAFDDPNYEKPTQIDAPENARTTIVRDVFGKPLEINRGPSS